MIPYEIEAVYFLSTIIYTIRLYFQAKQSRREKRSVNPSIYWLLTIVASILMVIYSYLIGSILMPIVNSITVIYSLYHYRLEKRRE